MTEVVNFSCFGKLHEAISSTASTIACCTEALMTLKEYLEDYASPETKAVGERVIAEQLPFITSPVTSKYHRKSAKFPNPIPVHGISVIHG